MEAHVLQLILCVAWLTGLLLLGVSLQATRMLNDPRPSGGQEDRSLRLTVYTAPLPFEGLQGLRQSVAINSWLKLSPCPQVVLLGQHPSLHSFANTAGSNVTVDSEIDFTFLGSPLFHSMVGRARASHADVAILVDAELVLLQDVVESVESMQKLKGDWLLVSMSRSVPSFPFFLGSRSDVWRTEDGGFVEPEEIAGHVTETGLWDECEGNRLWVWNVGAVPLHAGVMPPFVYRQGQHNQWLLNEVLSSGFRTVIDGSEAVSVINPLQMSNDTEAWQKADGRRQLLDERPWEFQSNSQFSALYGSFLFKRANFSNIQVKLVRCAGSLCFLKASEKPPPCISNRGRSVMEGHNSGRSSLLRLSLPSISSSTLKMAHRRQLLLEGHYNSFGGQLWIHDIYRRGSGFWDKFTGSMFYERQTWQQGPGSVCNTIPKGRRVECAASHIEKYPGLKSSLSMPFKLDSLAEIVCSEDKVVVLAVVGNSYRDMLMSWVCRLRVLGISNFLISALDEDLYQFAVQQGLPVFKDAHTMNVSRNDCHFGSKCFQKVTKVKSRTVLKLLRLGYHVLFSDVDVYWFENPLQRLMQYGPGNLVAQTDQYNSSFPDNEPRRLNSGFYFAWSDNDTIAAFEMIVKHAAKSSMSEQPSFYDVLCGPEGKYRVGNTKCREPKTGLTVHFLKKDDFPNGAYAGLWEKKDVKKECRKRGCLVLHNNWINGRLNKVQRQIEKGLWQYDVSSRMCLRSWQGPNSVHAY